MAKGLFITFEGGEGCGKTSQIGLLKKWCEENQVEALFTKEPGGTPLGEELRKILKHSEYEFCPLAELLLFNASRAEICESVIRPTLASGINVVCDRFYDSTIAYQGSARGIDENTVINVCKTAINGCEPDVTFWLDISPEEAFARKGGADLDDRLEQTGLEFHKKVYETYQRLFRLYPERIVRIDATQDIEHVHNQIVTELNKRLQIQ